MEIKLPSDLEQPKLLNLWELNEGEVYRVGPLLIIINGDEQFLVIDSVFNDFNCFSNSTELLTVLEMSKDATCFELTGLKAELIIS